MVYCVLVRFCQHFPSDSSRGCAKLSDFFSTLIWFFFEFDDCQGALGLEMFWDLDDGTYLLFLMYLCQIWPGRREKNHGFTIT